MSATKLGRSEKSFYLQYSGTNKLSSGVSTKAFDEIDKAYAFDQFDSLRHGSKKCRQELNEKCQGPLPVILTQSLTERIKVEEICTI